MIKTMGSWPLTSDATSGVWSNASWDLMTALNTAHQYRAFPFFAVYVGVDDKNSSSYVITVCACGVIFIARCYAECGIAATSRLSVCPSVRP